MAGEGYGQELISGLTVSSPLPSPRRPGEGEEPASGGCGLEGVGVGRLPSPWAESAVCFLPTRVDRPAVCQSLWSDFTHFPPFLLGLPPSF